MKLTKNFNLSEFTCKCGNCEIPPDVLGNIKILAEQLQIIRNRLNKPIKINSGYRCKYHNDITVKGSKNFTSGGRSRTSLLLGLGGARSSTVLGRHGFY